VCRQWGDLELAVKGERHLSVLETGSVLAWIPFDAAQGSGKEDFHKNLLVLFLESVARRCSHAD
jgi:hypothetical protein